MPGTARSEAVWDRAETLPRERLVRVHASSGTRRRG